MEKREDIPAERRRGWGNGRCGHRPFRPVEWAAGSLRPRFADLATGDEIPDRAREFGLGIAGRHHTADLVAVVDPAFIADLPVAVHEDHLGRDGRIEGLGQREIGVEMDRKRDAELRAVGLDLRGVVGIADDAYEANAVLGESGCEFVEHRTIFLRHRAGRMEKREADSPPVAEKFVEPVRRSVETRDFQLLLRHDYEPRLRSARRVRGTHRYARERPTRNCQHREPAEATTAGSLHQERHLTSSYTATWLRGTSKTQAPRAAAPP